jgi:hypothetical protein
VSRRIRRGNEGVGKEERQEREKGIGEEESQQRERGNR